MALECEDANSKLVDVYTVVDVQFSTSPQLSYMESWKFSTWQFFLHEFYSWYSWQISGLGPNLTKATSPHVFCLVKYVVPRTWRWNDIWAKHVIQNYPAFFEIQKNVFMNWSSEQPTPGSVMPQAICLLLLRWVVLEPLVCLATMAFGAYITQQGIYRQLEQSLLSCRHAWTHGMMERKCTCFYFK